MRVGIVCEGVTDFAVLKAIAEAVLVGRQPTFSLLQPDHDRVRRPGEPPVAGGWQTVRSFLKAGNAQLSLARIDVVIVQVDASVRLEGEVVRRLASDELEGLCDHVKEWIGDPIPASVVITLPCEEIETWLVAVHTRRKGVEAIDDPAGALVEEGLIGTRNGRPDKKSADYSRLSEPLKHRVGEKRWLRSVPELERLCSKLRARVRARRG